MSSSGGGQATATADADGGVGVDADIDTDPGPASGPDPDVVADAAAGTFPAVVAPSRASSRAPTALAPATAVPAPEESAAAGGGVAAASSFRAARAASAGATPAEVSRHIVSSMATSRGVQRRCRPAARSAGPMP
ncbi:hypothetical protein B446_04575 [Streptomyces collinus Tu 365]|uniref:Uncharacterized protein n=1 Tax=Streptomyces collinus (strain DSM 40733 / Tue 365) TaxID=1214242 RepID=S5ULF5_STRC3|nr:hypothetical protein B446_04575 [Streptomyces collinus Tu 365]